MKNWPPLIVAEHTPTWVKWRDFALTFMMWLLFAIMLATEFELFFGVYLERMGLGDFDTEANWTRFFELLRPYLVLMLALVTMLFISSLLTWRRRHRSLALAPPPPLTVAEAASRVGMDEAALAKARELRVAVVHIDADGRHRIEPR